MNYLNIFEFNEYKEYLEAWLLTRPKRGHGELQKIANYLQIHPSLASQVLRSGKQFTFEQAYSLTKYLQLNMSESEFFLALVQISRSGTKELHEYWMQKKETLRQESLDLNKRLVDIKNLNPDDQAEFYSFWYYSAIRLLCSIPAFQTREKLKTAINLPEKKLEQALIFLSSRKLIIEENGVIKMGVVHTHLSKDSPHLVRHHSNWRLKAMQQSENLKPDDFCFTAPATISRATKKLIQRRLIDLSEEIMRDYMKPSKEEILCCLNIDWFECRLEGSGLRSP